MTNPNLAEILRRFYALAAATMVPAGALLLFAGRQQWAGGLCFGAFIAVLNAGMLVWRINRATARGDAGQALRIMQQGMGVRFSMIFLAAVVVVKVDAAAIPGFLLGLVVTMVLAVAVATRAMLQSDSEPLVTSEAEREVPAPAPSPTVDASPAAAALRRRRPHWHLMHAHGTRPLR